MRTSILWLVASFSLCLNNAFAQEVKHSRPLGKERVIYSKKIGTLSFDPADQLWNERPTERIPLIPQRFVAPNGGGGVKWIDVKSFYTTKDVFFLLTWEDKTESAKLAASGKFTDACAIEFPFKEGSMPSPFMGEKGNPVNIWMWRAVAKAAPRYPVAYSDFYRQGSIDEKLAFPDKPVQNLLAEGFGSLSLSAVQDVAGSGLWKDGKWSVVIKRRLSSKGGSMFRQGLALPVAFAVWDGDNAERDGAKSVSIWHTLNLGAVHAKTTPKTQVEPGNRLYTRYGCVTCHGPEGKGGVKNPNAQGDVVPALNKVAEGFTKGELIKVIRDGRLSELDDKRGPHPFLRMVAWKEIMDDDEINALVEYLFALMPKGEDEW